VPIDVAANLAMTSTMTFIVGQMSVKDIRTIRSMRQALMQRHVPGDSLRVVINRYSRRSRTVPMKDAQKALGDVPMELIGNDFRSAIGGINFGKPLSEFAARTSLRRDIRELAEMVVQSTAQTDGVKAA
jgi:Flp pilus assembly CpaE family ATPase